MQENFGFYSSISNDFLKNLGSEVEKKSLADFLQEKIRPQLFDTSYCDKIGGLKKRFLTEIIKLEQYLHKTKYKTSYLNDLETLKKIAEAIYELLEKHWELYKYQSSHASNEALISFILEMDRIQIGWDAYREKYIVISTLLKSADTTELEKEQALLTVKYHLPEKVPFTLEMANSFYNFLQFVFTFVLKVHNCEEGEYQLSLHSLEVRSPITCTLITPAKLQQSYNKFLSYLSVDVLKRETLVKYAMEVVRLQQVQPLPKNSLTSYHKNISKFLKALHPEGYLSVSLNEGTSSIKLLSNLCLEMEKLDIRYSDLLTNASENMARDKVAGQKRDVSTEQKKTTPEPTVIKPTPKPAVKPAAKIVARPAAAESIGKSTVKIDVENKEHINFLTS
jgi:hypothetical protein